MSERSVRMLDALMVPEQDDPAVVAVMDAGASELDSAQATAEVMREHAWPMRADDTYGLLAIHESMLGLPINAAAGLAQRRAAVRAAVQSRKVGSKANWAARLTTLLRELAWSYEEHVPDPLHLTISIPYGDTSYTWAQVVALALRITPAHVVIHVQHVVGDFEPDYAWVAEHHLDYAEVAASYPDYADLAGVIV